MLLYELDIASWKSPERSTFEGVTMEMYPVIFCNLPPIE